MKNTLTILMASIIEKCNADNFSLHLNNGAKGNYLKRFAKIAIFLISLPFIFSSAFSQVGVVVCPGGNVTFAPKDGLGPYAWYTSINAGSSPVSISNTFNYGVLNYNQSVTMYYYDKYYNLHTAYAKAAPTIDSSFTTPPGACQNMPQLFSGKPDVWGYCFSADGTTTGAAIVGGYPTTQTTNFTLSARVKWSGGGTTSSQWIVLNGNAGTSGYGLLVDGASKKLWVVLGGVKIITSNLTLTANKWTQLALIRKGIRWVISMDYNDYDLSDSTNPNPVGNGGFYVGQDNTTPSFNGKIDEVTALNNIVDGAALLQIGSPFQGTESGSVWHFDEASGTTAIDAGTNHLNLTLKKSSYSSVSNYLYSVSNNANGEANQSYTFKVLGQTYVNLNVTDSYGCTPTDSYSTSVIVNNTVPVNPSPVASSNTICVGDAVDLTIQGSGLLLNNSFNNTAGVGWTAGPGWTGGASIRDFHPSFTYTTRDGSEIFGLFANGGKYNSSLTSPAFSTLNSTGIQILLDHYIIPGDAADFFVEMSTDNTNWTKLIQYGGSGVGQGTYTNFALSTINVPTAFENKAQVYLRFRYVDPANYGTNIYTGWYINNLVVYRGSVPPSFTWTSSPSGFTSSQQNNYSVSPLVTTTYYVSQSTGCSSGQASITVNVNPVPSATIAGTTALCLNSTSPTITFKGSGATAPYTFTYNINGGASQTVSSAANSSTATVIAPTSTAGNFTYNLVKVTSSLGCAQSLGLNATVTVYSLPTATISVPASVCANTSAITFTATGGLAPYIFFFNYSGSTQSIAAFTNGSSNTTSFPAPATAGAATYIVTSISDANNCGTTYSGSARPTANIYVNALPAATLGTIPTIGVTATSFTLPYTVTDGNPDRYSVTKGSTNVMPNFAAVTNATLTAGSIGVSIPATASGTYNFNLTLQNSTSTCTSTIPFTVTIAYNKLNTVGLDYSTTASPAYALRLLSSEYKGKAINVRRSSDNTLQDIGFTTNGDLDTLALKNFVGVGNGFVAKWYDQSGHAYDATQATAAIQPLIVTLGVLERINAKPAIYFGTSNLATAKTTIFTAGASMVGVAKGNSTSSAFVTKTGTSAGANLAYPAPFDFTNSGNEFVVGNASNTSSYNVVNLATSSPQAIVNASIPASVYAFTIPTTGTYFAYRNGVQAASNTVPAFTDNGNALMIGNRNDLTSNGNFWTSEIVLFNSFLSTTDRQKVENAEKGYYISPETVYVDSANGNDNDFLAGTSWAKAYKTLSKALYDAHAAGNGIKTILIAKGSYYAAGTAETSNSRWDSTFYIYRNALKIYGGYNATTGLRDLSANKVYLDGNGITAHVMVLSGIPAGDSVVVDGLTILNGNASNSYPVLLYNGASINGNSGGGLNVRLSSALGSKIAFRNCAFLNNSAWNGGAAFIENSSPIFTNCLFANNAGLGGGVVLFDYNLATPQLTNCTISNNQNDYANSVFYNASKSVVTMYNTILWGGNVSIYNSDIVDKLIADSCIIQGGYSTGTHISVADPLFANADQSNFRLSAQSPAINAGSATKYTGTSTDLDGKPRIIGTIDMGAYESQPNNLDKVNLTATTLASPAYSLRMLSTAYTGKAINVRRSSDSVFMNIGFTPNGDLDTATLKTFVGNKTGYVACWYDQSGFGYDAAQTDTAKQPKIITTGIVERVNGKPAIYFGTSNLATIKATIYTAGASMVGVAKGNSTSSSAFITKTGTNTGVLPSYPAPFDFTNKNSQMTVGNAAIPNISAVDLSVTQPSASTVSSVVPASVYGFVIPTSGNFYTYRNGIQQSSTAFTGFGDNGNPLMIGNRNDLSTIGNFWTPEILLFNAALDTISRQAAETSQKNYYMTTTVLPITLMSFTGTTNNGSNVLQWATATETNNKGFYVERSSDGLSFTNLGFVAGSGNSSSIKTYGYTDAQPLSGNNFYKLRQVDVDGETSFSNIIVLASHNPSLIAIFPNPVKNLVTVTVGNGLVGEKVYLFTSKGQLVKQTVVRGPSFMIDLSGLASGIYLLKLQDGTIAKIVKE